MRRWSLSLPHLEAVASGPCHLSDRRLTEPTEDHDQGRLRVCVYQVALTVAGGPTVTDGLDGDLARLQEWTRREDGPVRVRAAGLRCPAWCGGCPGIRAPRPPPWLFALRRAAAAGAASYPAGASRPPSAGAPAFPPCRVRGHAPPGARRAPRALEDVKKVLTDRNNVRCRRLAARGFLWSGGYYEALAAVRSPVTHVYSST